MGYKAQFHPGTSDPSKNRKKYMDPDIQTPKDKISIR